MKDTISGFKQNEDTLKRMVEEASAKYHLAEERYNRLRSHAEDKISE
jgi:Transforming acidic coiled-coil-containing protein (TACC), C-terminal